MDEAYVARTYARFPLAVNSGTGAACKNDEGGEFLDFTSGIGVNVLGFCHPAWVRAVQEQAAQVAHISNLFYTAPGMRLAELLSRRTGCKRTFFCNSGAEANEGAIKAARKYSHDKYGPERSEIITLVNSFHGRTITTLSATGQDVFHKDFGPFTPGFVHARANDCSDLAAKLSPNTCAIMMELVQGEGGVLPLTREFTDAVASICKQRDILLVLDEVQTGVGHTGTFLACEQFGLSPDIVTLAKGLGGGLPIGAVLLYEKCADTLGPGDHATTFGGNPVSCAGACAVLGVVDDALLRQVREKSESIVAELLAMPHVKGVTGLGLMLGVEFEDGIAAKEVLARCLAHGVLFLTAKTKLRLLPPLTITQEQIVRGLAVLRNELEHWEENGK